MQTLAHHHPPWPISRPRLNRSCPLANEIDNIHDGIIVIKGEKRPGPQTVPARRKKKTAKYEKLTARYQVHTTSDIQSQITSLEPTYKILHKKQKRCLDRGHSYGTIFLEGEND